MRGAGDVGASVIMTVHNGQRYLAQAINSILAQTFTEFEFLIVDDASTDDTPRILAEFAARDHRISVLRNEQNIGPYPSANRALAVARAPLIARMDADDISEPERLACQLSFMNANPRCLLVGSGYRSIDEKGRTRFVKIDPMDFEQAQWTTRFRMPMVHPSFCFRRVLPDGQAVHYDEAFAVASDYALAASLSAAGPIASIGQPLIRYRMHPENISSTRLDRQRHVAHHISNNRVNDDYPEGVATALGPLLDLLYRKIPVGHRSLKLAIKGIDLAMATDSGGSPPDWMTKRAAGILAEACLGNLRVPGLIQFAPRFILFAPHHLSPLARRFRDLRLRYPSGVATDP